MPPDPHPATLLAERASRRAPDDLAQVVSEVARDVWGAVRTVLLVVTLEQTELAPLPGPGRAVPVDDGPAGRCYERGEPTSDGPTCWVPVTHRGERLGVLGIEASTISPDDLTTFAAQLGLLLVAGRGTSDVLEVARRTQEMHVGAELLAAVLPPLSYADDRVSLAAVLEPTYGAGGDAIDYAVEDGALRAVILDATGHGFAAALVSVVAVAAFRATRRAGEDLLGSWSAMDRWVGDAGDGSRYATAALVELRLDTGRLTWVTAGHPAPVVVRADGQVQQLESDPAPPLGTGLGGEPTPGEDYLEPGDVLVLHTDGLTEARGLDGRMLGVEGFLAALRDEVARGGLLAERLRRLRLDLLARDDAWLSDDATALVVEWHG